MHWNAFPRTHLNKEITNIVDVHPGMPSRTNGRARTTLETSDAFNTPNPALPSKPKMSPFRAGGGAVNGVHIIDRAMWNRPLTKFELDLNELLFCVRGRALWTSVAIATASCIQYLSEVKWSHLCMHWIRQFMIDVDSELVALPATAI